MCFNYSVNQEPEELGKRFDAVFSNRDGFQRTYNAWAFEFPGMPVMVEEDKIRSLEWGLIPFWVKDTEKAETIRKMTFNARAENIFETPSFRVPVRKRRCIVIADGFFEWHHRGGRRYPYYLRLKSGDPFGMAGIWDRWESHDTFSIITTDANSLVAEIHNTKKRMPVILKRATEKRWLSEGLSKDDIKEMLVPYPEDEMEGWPVGRHGDEPEALERVHYPELDEQKKLF